MFIPPEVSSQCVRVLAIPTGILSDATNTSANAISDNA